MLRFANPGRVLAQSVCELGISTSRPKATGWVLTPLKHFQVNVYPRFHIEEESRLQMWWGFAKLWNCFRGPPHLQQLSALRHSSQRSLPPLHAKDGSFCSPSQRSLPPLSVPKIIPSAPHSKISLIKMQNRQLVVIRNGALTSW